jgi:Flp pilus assembly protein TadD
LQAELLVKQLETMHALVLQALVGEQVEIPGRVRIVALRSPSQFKELSGSEPSAAYFAIGRFGEPLIVLPFDGIQAQPELVVHELAHHISSHLFPRQPHWFAEGLAYFVQTVVRFEDTEPATGTHLARGDRDPSGGVGLMPRDFMAWLKQLQLVPVKELLEWRGREDRKSTGRYHLSSWLLYHWLWNNRSKEFSQYQTRLSEAEDPAAAWRTALPEFDPDKLGALGKLDNELESYSRSARYTFYKVKARAEAAFMDAPLPPADVHILLLDASKARSSEALIRAELEEALRDDAAQPVALAWRAEIDRASSAAALRKSTTARPRDWRAWLLLGLSLTEAVDKTEHEAALRKAVELNPDTAAAQNALAWTLAKDGRSKEALAFANRAVDLAPWDPKAIDTLALVAANLGKCAQALVLQRRAVDLLQTQDSTAEEMRKTLRGYEGRCGKGETTPGTSTMVRE